VGEERARLRLLDAAELVHHRAGGVERLRQRADVAERLALQQLQQRRLAGAVGAGDRDALAAVQAEVDVVQDAQPGAAEPRDQAAAVGGLVELQPHGGRLARALDPVGRRHLALEPVLA
jgi:hypothetical protein